MYVLFIFSFGLWNMNICSWFIPVSFSFVPIVALDRLFPSVAFCRHKFMSSFVSFLLYIPMGLKGILLLQVYMPVSLIVQAFIVICVVQVISLVTVVRSSNGNSVNSLQSGRSPDRLWISMVLSLHFWFSINLKK